MICKKQYVQSASKQLHSWFDCYQFYKQAYNDENIVIMSLVNSNFLLIELDVIFKELFGQLASK